MVVAHFNLPIELRLPREIDALKHAIEDLVNVSKRTGVNTLTSAEDVFMLANVIVRIATRIAGTVDLSSIRMNDVEAMQRAFQLYLHFKKKVEARQYEALIRLPAQQEPKRRSATRASKQAKHEAKKERNTLINQLASSGKVTIVE